DAARVAQACDPGTLPTTRRGTRRDWLRRRGYQAAARGRSGVTDRLLGKKDGAIGWVVFNNPARRNAVSLDMWEAMPRVLGDFVADPQIRAIVLTGAGDK